MFVGLVLVGQTYIVCSAIYGTSAMVFDCCVACLKIYVNYKYGGLDYR